MAEGKYDVRRDRILFVDVEMTCWEGPPPAGQDPEIIEFGLAEVDVGSLALLRSASLLVRPVRSEVSGYCEGLTGLDARRLRSEGRPLAEVVATLRRSWGTASKAWMSWGADQRAVDRECARAGIHSPFSASFHDIGLQFGLMLGEKRGVGLSQAIGLLGIERHGRVHSGEGDAVTTANAWIAMAADMRARLTCRPDAVDAPRLP